MAGRLTSAWGPRKASWPSPPRWGISPARPRATRDRKSTRLNSSHSQNSYAVFCLTKTAAWLYRAAAHKALNRVRGLRRRERREFSHAAEVGGRTMDPQHWFERI